MVNTKKVAVIIPIYHPDAKFCSLLQMLRRQEQILFDTYILDSGSHKALYESELEGLSHTMIPVDARQFNHGGTRQMAAELCREYPFLVYMTQDAIPADEHALCTLINAFSDTAVGCAYGRQLPHRDANVFAARARLFNYPATSRIKQLADAKELGIKVSFMSDTFAAYRQEALQAVGGFPRHVILGEDAYVGSRMILEGWNIAYCAEAMVYHSHNYSIKQEFQRYFDTGVFHSREPWIQQAFGKAESEGMRLVINELMYLVKNKPWLVPAMIMQNAAKLLGYKMGMHEKQLPMYIKRKCSMTKQYWEEE